jgi:hypothetical protein
MSKAPINADDFFSNIGPDPITVEVVEVERALNPRFEGIPRQFQSRVLICHLAVLT